MEQGRKARDPEQVEAWGRAAPGVAEAVLAQGRAVTAYVPTVAKKQHISRGLRVMSKNVLSVEQL